MVTMSLKILLTSFEKPTNPSPVRLYHLFHDMSLKSLTPSIIILQKY